MRVGAASPHALVNGDGSLAGGGGNDGSDDEDGNRRNGLCCDALRFR